MAYQSIFRRYEMKYMITQRQKEIILRAMEPYMVLDEYGRTTIRNVYFDTATYQLIRRSIEKPAYKEKLRIRSYGKADPESTVFVELKKKYDSVVYKRRIAMKELDAVQWISGTDSRRMERQYEGGIQKSRPWEESASTGRMEMDVLGMKDSHPWEERADATKTGNQIVDEIDYFKNFYNGLRPAVFLSYEREAYQSLSGDGFRITFDDHILCRQKELTLEGEIWGEPVLSEDKILMEIKTTGGIPLWLTKVLSEERIYKTSFSKYGTAYVNLIFPERNGSEKPGKKRDGQCIEQS